MTARVPGASALRRRRLLVALVVMLGAFAGCRSGPPPSLVEQGRAAFAARDYVRADALFARAIEEGRDVGPALHGRARVALVRRDPEASLRLYQELAAVDRSALAGSARDDYAGALLEAARTRLDRGRSESALAALRALEKVDPGKKGLADLMGRALVAEGERLVMRGQQGRALAIYREAIARKPGSAAAYVGAAEILLAAGRRQEALALLVDARAHDPTDSRVRALTVQLMELR